MITLAKPDYYKDDEVWCKICGAKIVSRETIKGRPQRIVHANYAEIKLDFEEGSHVTCLCKSCAENVDKESALSIYAADCAQWVKEEEMGISPLNISQIAMGDVKAAWLQGERNGVIENIQRIF